MSKNRKAELIRALLAKTTANGATEDEAMAAAAKARELMEKYELDHSELDVRAEGVEVHVYDEFATNPASAARYRIAVCVSMYTGVKIWSGGHQGHITLVGATVDVEFARWMLDTLTAYIVRAADAYAAGFVGPDKRRERSNFINACSSRISKRVIESIPKTPTGSGLVLVTKQNMIAEKMREMGITKLAPGGKRQIRFTSRDAWRAGQEAGDAASWNRPVGGGSSTPQLK